MEKGIQKPRIVIDIKHPRINAFSRIPERVNLSYKDSLRVTLWHVARYAAVGLGALYLFFGSVVAPVWPNSLFAASPNDAERAALEQQLVELEGQISEYESTIQRYRKEGTTLQSEIDKLNANIRKVNLQIQSINLSLDKLDYEIDDTRSQIAEAEHDITLNKQALSDAMQKLYENEQTNLTELLLASDQLSDFFSQVNGLLEVQDTFSLTVTRIVQLRDELLDKKEALALQRNDAVELKLYQASQQNSLAGLKKEKANLLDVTKGQESKFQSLLKETQKTAAQIRSRIFEFLGGGQLTFEEAYQFAKFAESATGVRAAMILAVLEKESALGSNVGRCDYMSSMHPTRDLPVFLNILAELKDAGKAPPEPILVSCAISVDGAYGGAMGPAQFIPSTWALYKNRIGQVTGNVPPNPWANGDAFVGTGLYIQDATNACKNTYSNSLDRERCAAARYYAGGNWRRHLWGYGDRVVTKAQQFQADIDILNGQ